MILHRQASLLFLMALCLLPLVSLGQQATPDSLRVRWTDPVPPGLKADTMLPCIVPCQLTYQHALKDLLLPLIKAGYPGAGSDSLTREGETLTAWLSAGPRIATNIQLESGQWISFDSIPYHLDSIVGSLAGRGYPFASSRLSGFSMEEGSIHAEILTAPGRQYRFSGFRQAGYRLLADDYLYVLSGIRPGDDYNEEKIRMLPEKIGAGGNVKLETPPLILFADSTFELQITARRSRSNEIWGMAGILADPESGSGIRLTGEARASFTHLLSHGDVFSFEWRSFGKGSQELNLAGSYPYLFSQPFGVEAAFMLSKIDTLFLRRHTSATVSYLPSAGRSFGLNASFWQGSELGGTANSVRRQMTGLKISLKELDREINPQRGFLVRFSLQSGITSTRSGDETAAEKRLPRGEFGLYSEAYIPFGRLFTLKTALQGNVLTGPSIKEIEFYRTGGNRDIRGYEEQSFSVPAYGVGTVEFRLLPDPGSRIGLSWDMAYLYDTESSGLYHGFGITTGLSTGAGFLLIGYALPKLPGQAVLFSQGKVHIGIEASF